MTGKHRGPRWFVRFHPSGDPAEFIVQALKQLWQAVAQTIMEHTFYPTKLADAQLISTALEMLDSLAISTDNIALAHDECCSNKQGLSIDLCPCPLAANWRTNIAILAKARGQQ